MDYSDKDVLFIAASVESGSEHPCQAIQALTVKKHSKKHSTIQKSNSKRKYSK